MRMRTGKVACVTCGRVPGCKARVERLIHGNPGDVKPVGGGVAELRIDYGPGYHVYYVMRGRSLIILLSGGDKRSQSKDIAMAIQFADGL